ncbi:DNA methyltransferase [Pseudoalteromonas sp. SiA1]|uniref:DNA methyltransferase n=1 Tax=Pseudoalteromonas sp. SiA1 TaxID=2839744 RepID=UPI001C004B9A|nr:DNA methyltransferase [Pseudoalteromonas sp. SiA1]QWF33175.1 site-specific DNA-methyltransferase [Pseudoalteromonas sp. SiA1]
MNSVLNDLDWDFKDKNTKDPIHRIHPYPAKFIPDIPSQLIDALGVKNNIILDPFCGSGTTLKVAQDKGYQSIGVDLNPIACLISEVKTSKIDESLLLVCDDVLSKAINLSVDIDSVANIPNLNHWFKKEVQLNILQLREAINAYKDETHLYHPLRVALSSILVKVSNQDSDTRYAAVEKNIKPGAVFSMFRSTCKVLASSLNSEATLPSSKIINKDILTTTPEDIGEKVGLVITSPPYPNAYEYWLYHKYRMFWLGFDPLHVKSKEIGARAHFFKKNSHTPEHFYHQMKGTLSLINDVLLPKGYGAFVVGRSKIHGEIVDNAALIERAAKELEFKVVGKFNRAMNSHRKSFNLSHANIKEETIVVIQK